MGKSYASKVIPAKDVVEVIPGASALPNGTCRAILVGVAGNLNITTLEGNERDNVPFQAGINEIQATHIRAGATSPAANIWAVY